MKNNLIRLLALGLLLAMLFTMVGCNGSETPDDPDDSGVQQGDGDSDSDSDSESESESDSDSESETEQQLSEKELRRLRTIEFISYNIAFYDINHGGSAKDFDGGYEGQSGSDYLISKRQERLKIFVEHYSPDVLALQEVNHVWWPYLITNEDSLLNKMGYEYKGNISAYRQKDGRGNIDNELYNLLFWNPEKFDLVKAGHFWVTPNGSPVMGNADKSRMCTWAILKNKDTGFETLYASTHLVTGGSLEGKNESLSLAQAKRLTTVLNEAAEGRPIVVGGDFNANEGAPSYKHITGEGGLKDAKYNGKTRLNVSMTSFRSWGKNKSYASSGNPIDHIFYSGDLIIDKWMIMPDTVNANGTVSGNTGGKNYDISDHLGVYVKVREPDPK